MSRSKLARKLAVPLRDFMLGLGIFLVLAFVCTGVSVVDGRIAFDVAHARFLEPAGTAEMVTVTDASVGQFGRELQRAVTFGLLAMTFAHSVILISFSGLRVSFRTAATISSV